MQPNKIISIILILLFGLFSSYTLYSKTPNEFANSEATLPIIGDPADFVVAFYARVLATQYMQGDNTEDMRHIASQFFSPSLNEKFQKIYDNTLPNTGNLGCMDFSPFTGAQEILRGFLVDPASTQNDPLTVSVHVSVSSLSDLQKPGLHLQIVKTPQGFRIDNIVYAKDQGNLQQILKGCLKKKT